MKTLLIFRHAKSDWGDPGLPDADRPLNKRGKRDAPRMGRLMRSEGLLPDIILVSSAKRARQTVEAAAEAAAYQGEEEIHPEFYMAGPDAYLQAVSDLDDRIRCAMVVGHNPGLEELLAGVTGTGEGLPTAALARVDLPIDHWKDLRPGVAGRLVHIWRPKEL
ncbi:MAG: histidine phosphatase family protein [Chloroflexi bacterium]|nr:histidine phosphatase family protein [Chloroflexota bacterium]